MRSRRTSGLSSAEQPNLIRYTGGAEMVALVGNLGAKKTYA
jgi:hypothetical protein